MVEADGDRTYGEAERSRGGGVWGVSQDGVGGGGGGGMGKKWSLENGKSRKKGREKEEGKVVVVGNGENRVPPLTGEEGVLERGALW